jgi:autotransporter-associated beta strand protein
MVTLSGNNSFTGSTSVSGGTLVAANNNALGSGSVDVSGSTLLANSGVTVGNAITVDAGVGSPQLVAYWNFNSLSIATASSPGSGGVPLTIAANQGSGTLSLANWGGLVDDFNGSTINVLSSEPAEESLSLLSTSGSGNASYLQISEVDLTGLTNVQVSFATQRTNTGFNANQWSYSTDGSSFTNFGSAINPSTSFALATVTTNGLNDVSAGFLRYTLNGASGTSQNNRIDNLQVTASSLTLPTLGSAATTGTATFSGNITLDSAVQLTSASGGAVEFTGIIADGANGAKGITKVGDGVVVLGGTNTYTGATVVSTGTLLIDGDQALATGDVTVASGATLGGSGTVGGNTTILSGGFHAPGDGLSTQYFTGDLTYSSGSTFLWQVDTDSEIYGAVESTVTGTTLGGSGAIFNIGSSTDYSDDFWKIDQSWSDIFIGFETSADWNAIFSSIIGTNLTWNGAGNRADATGGYGYFTLTADSLNWTAIPEPTSALAGLLLGAGLLRRRRRSA